MSISTIKRVAATAVAVGAIAAGAAAPAHAFTNENSINVSGTRYYVKAYSCNIYVTSCSWSANATISSRKSYTHVADVKANGFGVSITISASPGVTITGNSTSLASGRKTGTGTSSSMSGVARPSIFSVSVAARSKLWAGGQYVSTGWTTW